MAPLRSVLYLEGTLSNGVSQMELSITYDKYCSIFIQIRGEFNNARARRALVDWYLSLFVMCKAWHQYNER